MLRLNSYHGYSHRRRYVTIRVDPEYPIDKPRWRARGYEMRLYPHPADQRIVFHWSGHWQYERPFKTRRAMGLMVEVKYANDQTGSRWVMSRYVQAHTFPDAPSPYAGWDFAWPNPTENAPASPNVDWGALLQVGKAVAAGRAEPLVVMGWIEDHLPEPWSLLASPDPIEAFRALSPVPLYED